MNRPVLNGWGLASLVLLTIYTIWFCAVITQNESEILMWLLWSAPMLAGCLASYKCPNHILVFGVLIAVTTVVISVTSNIIYQFLGNQSDFSGLEGNLFLMITTFIYSVIFSILGSLVGNRLTKR